MFSNEKYNVEINEPVALLPEQFNRILAAAAVQQGLIGRSTDPRCEKSWLRDLSPWGPILASDWWPACLLFIFSLGIRLNAALNVPTRNIDWERGEVVIPAFSQKHRREQRLDLIPSAIEASKKLNLSGRRVPTVLGDWPYKPKALQRHYKKILVEAGLFDSVEAVPRTYLFHCLRKTLASQLYEKAGIHVACARLGLSTPQVTERYIDPRYKEAPLVRNLLSDPLSQSDRRGA